MTSKVEYIAPLSTKKIANGPVNHNNGFPLRVVLRGNYWAKGVVQKFYTHVETIVDGKATYTDGHYFDVFYQDYDTNLDAVEAAWMKAVANFVERVKYDSVYGPPTTDDLKRFIGVDGYEEV